MTLGKNEAGLIEIQCLNEEDEIIEIRFSDDGKGINENKIFQSVFSSEKSHWRQEFTFLWIVFEKLRISNFEILNDTLLIHCKDLKVIHFLQW